MANNHTITKLLQVHEEAAPAVHIPILVGNQVFMIVQQDIRRTEDIRQFSYNQVLPGQHILPILSQLNANAYGYSAPATQLSALQQQNTSVFPTVPPVTDVEMENKPFNNATNVSKQLFWSKQQCTSPYPIKYSIATSTSGLQDLRPIDNTQKSCAHTQNCSCQTCTKSTSTDAGSQTIPQSTSTGKAKNLKETKSSDCLLSGPSTHLQAKKSAKSLFNRRSSSTVRSKSKTSINKQSNKEKQTKERGSREEKDHDKAKDS